MNKKTILSKLRKAELLHNDLPDELQTDFDVIKAERKAKTRLLSGRGYDVISDSFFVIEQVYFGLNFEGNDNWKKSVHSFFSFDDYFKYLDGASLIENACYYKMDSSKIMDGSSLKESAKHDAVREIEKTKSSLTNDKLSNYSFGLSKEEKEKYNSGEKLKKKIAKWVNKFRNISSYSEFLNLCNKYSETDYSIDLDFLVWNYVFKDDDIWSRFDILMKFLISDRYPAYKMANALCIVYGPDKILDAYVYDKGVFNGVKGTFYKHRSRKKSFANSIHNIKDSKNILWFFDEETHYFCKEVQYSDGWNTTSIFRYFESFSDFINHKGDLCDCDLSKAYGIKEDLSGYKMNKNTILPISRCNFSKYVLSKGFEVKKDRLRDEEYFYVKQQWLDLNDKVLKEYNHEFKHFFDFVSFLDGDLTNSDLIKCEGLKNIADFSDLKLEDAKVTNDIALKAGLKQDSYSIDTKLLASFPEPEKNESETELLPANVASDIELLKDHLSLLRGETQENERKIYYISDLHLLHRIHNAKCQSFNDALLVIDRIAEQIINQSGRFILIGGDTSSDFGVFKLFLNALDNYKRNQIIVFVLGNHEFWPYEEKAVNDVFQLYKEVISEHSMFLLNNSVLYEVPIGDHSSEFRELNYTVFNQMSKEDLRSLLSSAKMVLFGGTAFSGYNETFNANNGIYRNAIDRKQEIFQTKQFENCYMKFEDCFYDKNVVVLTHTPKSDWCSSPEPFKNFVYVNGHNHRNYFYDDGEYRVYSDNQLGYHGKVFGMKYFHLNYYYDTLADYKDGIYSISRDDYVNFCRGKNLKLSFNRDVNELLMLKRNGYYCFLHKGKMGNLSILNGGTYKKLAHKDERYYFDNMDKVIATILAPLDKYTKYQTLVADTVKQIGGDGKIHGCIVDIDFFNHIYVNPSDLKLTGYFALDIIGKYAYENIPTLLEMERPDLYENYKKLLQTKSSNPFAVQKRTNEGKGALYLETDIYAASREIKKMQKLYSNILSTWVDSTMSLLDKHNI
jgi:predicted MPP superfamily phosphohydrolase